MKDKDLREILEKKGLIDLYDSHQLCCASRGFHASHVSALLIRVKELEQVSKSQHELNHIYSESIKQMREQLDAINEHYGITVERSEAKWEVREAK